MQVKVYLLLSARAKHCDCEIACPHPSKYLGWNCEMRSRLGSNIWCGIAMCDASLSVWESRWCYHMKIKNHETASQKMFCNDSIMIIYYFFTRNSMVTSILAPDSTFDTFLLFVFFIEYAWNDILKLYAKNHWKRIKSAIRRQNGRHHRISSEE